MSRYDAQRSTWRLAGTLFYWRDLCASRPNECADLRRILFAGVFLFPFYFFGRAAMQLIVYLSNSIISIGWNNLSSLLIMSRVFMYYFRQKTESVISWRFLKFFIANSRASVAQRLRRFSLRFIWWMCWRANSIAQNLTRFGNILFVEKNCGNLSRISGQAHCL